MEMWIGLILGSRAVPARPTPATSRLAPPPAASTAYIVQEAEEEWEDADPKSYDYLWQGRALEHRVAMRAGGACARVPAPREAWCRTRS